MCTAEPRGAPLGWRLAPLLLVGCGSQAAAPEAPPSEVAVRSEVSAYLPLPHDFVYSYDTYSEGQLVGALWMHVSHPRPGRVDLKMGSRIVHLSIEPEGVRDLRRGWVLKAPLRAGARFQGASGEVTITRVDVAVETAAGSFKGCLETEENTAKGEALSRVTTLFCPEVGIVRLDIVATTERELVEERAVLKSYAKRVDINALDE
ncbi:MAG: hypothetical protein KIT72_05715 [Polyangiaceae bacterium]|nr:hypothetical protein [Polyangiaceae bacterium]MCW5789897.1 hypothetical protein [Polyangiaceae bacterium]